MTPTPTPQASETSEQANFMQVVEGSETCLNGHSPIVERPMDGTPWKCAYKGCKYAVDPLPTPVSSEDKIQALLDKLHAGYFEYTDAGVQINYSGNLDNKSDVDIDDFLKAQITLLLQESLDSIGEPRLSDFDIKPDSYDDVVKCIRWYKDRLKALTKKTGEQ